MVAEGVGFEPTAPFGAPVFKTGAFGHSAIPPCSNNGETLLETIRNGERVVNRIGNTLTARATCYTPSRYASITIDFLNNNVVSVYSMYYSRYYSTYYGIPDSSTLTVST